MSERENDFSDALGSTANCNRWRYLASEAASAALNPKPPNLADYVQH